MAYRNVVLCARLDHMKFAEFQDSEPHIEGFVDIDCDLLEIETYDMVGQDAHTLALLFARQLFTLCCVGEEPNVSVLGLILTGASIDRVIHDFEELLLHLGLGAGTEICILRDVWLEPARLLELDDAVDLGQLQPMLAVEFQVEVVGNIVAIVEEAG